jgi:hypothetical protein
MKSRSVRTPIRGIATIFLTILRHVLYVLLLLAGRVLQPVANLAIVFGLILFLFCLFLRRDMAIPMWAGAGLAVTAAFVSVFYDAALRLVAPDDVVIVSEL